MPTCYRHPSRETNVACSRCARPICPDCMISTPVGMRCPECARERTQVRQLSFGGLGSGAATATYALMGLNLIVFLAEIATGAGLFQGGGTVYAEGALYAPSIDVDGQWYRVVTSGFLHYGLFHLGLNMFVLYILGSLLEPAIGTPRFLGIYAVSLLGGSLGALLLDPLAVTVGASGAVFGLMAAAFFVARQRGMNELASQVGFLVLINLFFTFSVSSISVGGHLGGLAAGAVVALVVTSLERARVPGRLQIELGVMGALAVVAFLGCLAAAAAGAPDVVSPFG